MSAKLSGKQHAVLAALDRLLPEPAAPMDGQWPVAPVAARDVARETGQSTDGAAYTLRSLVRRQLAEIGSHDGDAAGYLLTAADRAEVAAEAARRAADRERLRAWLSGSREETTRETGRS
jgi:DNA-binding MarR family transcriptional regulator